MVEDVKGEMVALIPRLRRFAYALTGSQDEGDDLVQASCLKALGSLHQYADGPRLDSWMFRIVRTCWIDRVRASARRPQVSDPRTLELVSDEGQTLRAVEARSSVERAREVMRTLPEEQREVLALVAIDGLSYREAAEVLETPIGTVMSRLARARARLTASMEATP